MRCYATTAIFHVLKWNNFLLLEIKENIISCYDYGHWSWFTFHLASTEDDKEKKIRLSFLGQHILGWRKVVDHRAEGKILHLYMLKIHQAKKSETNL